MKPLEDRLKRETQRQRIVEKAVEAADRIILDGSDGSTEEASYLTAEVASKMMDKVRIPLGSVLYKKDLED